MTTIIDKAKQFTKEHLHGSSKETHTDTTATAADNPRSTNQGPHATNMGNAMDPRVDSDGSRGLGTHHTSTTHPVGHNLSATGHGLGSTGTTGTETYGTTGTTSTGSYGNNPQSSNLGPHSSNAMNKIDPRVDSDGDRGTGLGSMGTATNPAQHHGMAGTGTHGENPQSSNLGPHSSNLMNKMDPRVDSDGDRGTGFGTSTTTGHTAHHGTSTMGSSTASGVGNTYENAHGDNPRSTNLGPHSSNVMNKADPRVDSDGDRGLGRSGQSTLGGHSTTGTSMGSGIGTGTGASATGSGNAPTTSGPHNSDLLNKMDPRVDSDLDGSRTVGGNKTFQ